MFDEDEEGHKAVEAPGWRKEEEQKSLRDLRIECLEFAMRMPGNGEAESVVYKASVFENYVKDGKK